jgi:hypothetical protein
MSWLQKIEDNIIITTGEGSTFDVVWKNAAKQVSYNTAVFEFAGVAGSLVRRKLPKGNQYSIEIYFRGENHLDESRAFEVAAADPRPWTLSHPFYGRLSVQPVQLSFDNTALNVTKITGVVLETIEGGVNTSVDLADQIQADAQQLSENTAQSVTAIDADTQAGLTSQNEATFQNYKKEVEQASDLEALTTAFAKSRSAAQQAIAKPVEAMRTAQNLINLPFSFANSTEARIAMLKREFDNLVTSALGLTSFASKRVFEASGANVLATLAKVAGVGVYDNRLAVLNAAAQITGNYNTFISTLDGLQGDEYYPDRDTIAGLENIVNNTVDLLFQLAQDAKQERSYTLDADSNAILLAHRFYGLDDNDENLNRFIADNSLGLNEMLGVKKGRQVIYYI